jgi:hypothetical protein
MDFRFFSFLFYSFLFCSVLFISVHFFSFHFISFLWSRMEVVCAEGSTANHQVFVMTRDERPRHKRHTQGKARTERSDTKDQSQHLEGDDKWSSTSWLTRCDSVLFSAGLVHRQILLTCDDCFCAGKLHEYEVQTESGTKEWRIPDSFT